MNESEFENEMRSLRPSPPSSALGQAIARALTQPAENAGAVLPERTLSLERPRHSLLFGLCWAMGGAAAALTVTFSLEAVRGPAPQRLPSPAPSAPPSVRTFRPTDSTREVVSAEVGGLVFGDDQGLNRILHYSSVEKRGWADASTGARIEMEVPREDVFLVPVSFQ